MRARHIGAVLTSLFALPLVAAAPLSGINVSSISQTMSKLWQIMGAIVNIDPAVAPTVIKVLIFFLLFAIIFYVLKAKYFPDRKIAGVIAFAIAAIVALLTPNSGLIYTLISVAVPMSIVLGLVGLAWYHPLFNGKPGKLLMGALLIFIAFLINGFLIGNLPRWFEYGAAIQPGGVQYTNLIIPVLQFLELILLLLFLGKLLSAAFNAMGGGPGAEGESHPVLSKLGDWLSPEYWRNRDHENKKAALKRDIERAERENERREALAHPAKQLPMHPTFIEFREHPSNPAQVLVTWKPNNPDEKVIRYHVAFAFGPSPSTTAVNSWQRTDPTATLAFEGTIGTTNSTFKSLLQKMGLSKKTGFGQTYYYVAGTTNAQPELVITSGLPPRGEVIHFAICAENANGLGPAGFSPEGKTDKSPPAPTKADELATELRNIRSSIDATTIDLNRAHEIYRSLHVLGANGEPLDPLFPPINEADPRATELSGAYSLMARVVSHLSNCSQQLDAFYANTEKLGFLNMNPGLMQEYLIATQTLRSARNRIAQARAGYILATGVTA